MTLIIGLLVILTTVFGGYLLAGGNIIAMMNAIIHEFIVIGGASLGSYIISNPKGAIKEAINAVKETSKGHKWHKEDYIDLFLLMNNIFKIGKSKGLMVLEADLENPESSSIFENYTKIKNDPFVINLICDTFRAIIINVTNPYEIEDMIKDRINRHYQNVIAPSNALQQAADGLPAIGIVAAVLGVINTMAHVDKPPAILGAMLGNALVGTFLGVFLSYCFVGPVAHKIQHSREKDFEFYRTICDLFIYYMKGNPPSLAIEIARSIVAQDMQPSPQEVEDAMSNKV